MSFGFGVACYLLWLMFDFGGGVWLWMVCLGLFGDLLVWFIWLFVTCYFGSVIELLYD